MIYYIADMHFGHTNVIRFDDRPFADTEQMDEVLIQNWNERVTADDTVCAGRCVLEKRRKQHPDHAAAQRT